MGRIFNFDKMITPIFITLFFWMGIVAAMVGGFILIGFGMISDRGNMIHIIGGVISLFIGPLLIRVYSEMLMVVFKMQESLIQIRDLQSEQMHMNQRLINTKETVNIP